MSEARVLPVLGAILGALLGLVTMALLTVLGVLAPDRLPLFALIGIGIILGAAILTQRLGLAKKRLVTTIVVGALFAGVSLTGIPEVVRGGSMMDGCQVAGTSSLEASQVTPGHTSVIDGFAMTPTDTVQWETQTSVPITAATVDLSLMVGGVSIPVDSFEFAEAPEITTWSGQAPVESELAAIEEASGFLITGIYHVAIQLDTSTGQCAGNAYIAVVPDGPFDTTLLLLLWVVLGVLVVTLLALMTVVRRSIRESDKTLAMVGMSAIPGETSTAIPPSSPTPTGTSRLSEPTQPTAPEPSSGPQPTRERQRGPDEKPAPKSDSQRRERAAGDEVPPSEAQPSAEDADPLADQELGEADSEGDPRIGEGEGEGDPRIGEGSEAPQTPGEDDEDRPPTP